MLKAIETFYDGYKFRSRLEARWAVFFNTLGIKYEYEKEGYDLDGVRYLPDFWLPVQKCWIEIKGQEPTKGEHEKCFKLMKHANPNGRTDNVYADCYEKRVFLFAGDIPLPDVDGVNSKSCWSAYGYDCSDSHPGCFFGWTECPFCHMVNIVPGCCIDDLPCKCEWKYIHMGAIDVILRSCIVGKEGKPVDDVTVSNIINIYIKKRHAFLFWGNSLRLIDAYTAARQARFEYGERG